MQKRIWQIKNKKKAQTLDEFKKIVLENRQWSEADLSGEINLKKLKLTELAIDQKELKKAINRIEKAKKNKEKVLVFGDYDVDGNCATAIMWLGLKEIGILAEPFIPHRLKHGYGMTVVALQEIIDKQKPDLIITVDNGISASEALEFCKENKIEVIVTDHHLKSGQVDSAIAVVQSEALSGAGVAWAVIWQLWEKFEVIQREDKILEMLDLVALATIVDQVPLVGINRKITKVGLQKLRQSKRAGILALVEKGKTKQNKLVARDIGFGLGPRINAIGRITNTLEALRLLCTSNQALARKLAQALELTNGRRQELTTEMLEMALKQVKSADLDKIVVVASHDFHEGIIGLIASKLVDIFGRPAIAVSLNGKIGKASARSVEGVNITKFVRQMSDDLLSVGGHALAAGFAVSMEKWPKVEQKIRKLANEQIKEEQLVAKYEIEAEVSAKTINAIELESFLDQMEPFGAENPELTVMLVGEVVGWRHLGAENQHLKIEVSNEKMVTAVLFWNYQDKKVEAPKLKTRIAVIGEMKINEFRGVKKTDIWGKDWEEVEAEAEKMS